MLEILTPIFISFWLGILTSISPCPLATNIAALSITKNSIVGGIFYSLGRILTYIAVTVIIVTGFATIPPVSHFLRQYMNKLLGPLFILTGMVLTGLIKMPGFENHGLIEQIAGRIKNRGAVTCFVFGIIFALAFCPSSATIFFGSLIPITYKYDSKILLPATYGLGTAAPILFFAIILSLGTAGFRKSISCVSKLEKFSKPLTGIILIAFGIYFTLKYIF